MTAPEQQTGRAAPVANLRWPGYAAAAVAFVFAAVSLYWALGGEAGLSTLGGSFEELARARDPDFLALMWALVMVKVAGGVLALAVVQPWGRRLPRRWLLFTAWAGATVLTAYGGLQVVAVALLTFGVITPADPPDPTVLLWRLLLWEPWFLVWGLLLGLAARYAQRSGNSES